MKTRYSCRKSQQGLTLVELLITMIMIAILATLAVPSYRAFIVNQQLTAASGDFMVSLLQTRSEAMRLGRNVAIAPANGTDWTSGWNIFQDNDCTGTWTAANQTTNTLVISSPAMGPAVTVDMTAGRSTAPFTLPTPYFAYAPSGFLQPYSCAYATALGNGTLWLTANETNRSRAIVVAVTGRARICTPSPADNCSTP